MADRFDVVAVWIEDISTVVGRVVLGTKPRPPVIAPAGRDSSLMEGVYGSTVFAGERDVDGTPGPPCLIQKSGLPDCPNPTPEMWCSMISL
jgi:hypothetical protein